MIASSTVKLDLDQHNQVNVAIPTLWVSDLLVARQHLSSFFQLEQYKGKVDHINPGNHYILAERGTPEALVKGLAWKIQLAGGECLVYGINNSLENLVGEITAAKEMVIQIIEFARPYEEWSTRNDETKLTIKEAAEIAMSAISLLPEPKKSIELATLRERCNQTSYDWNRLMGKLEEEFKCELHKRLAAGELLTINDTGNFAKQLLDGDLTKKWTETSMGKELSEKYQKKLAWNTLNKRWYSYEHDSDGLWSVVSDEFVGKMVLNDAIARRGTTFSHAFLAGTIKIIKYELSIDKWNEATGLMPLQDGVLDPATMRLLPHSPDYRFLWQLPYKWLDRSIGCEPVINWLNETMQHNQELVQVLRAYLKAVVIGRADLHRFLEGIGPGGSGKSTYQRLAAALVGKSNTLVTSLKHLETNRFEQQFSF